MDQKSPLILKISVFISMVFMAGVAAIASLFQSPLGEIIGPLVFVLVYLSLMAAYWNMKRWGVYLYTFMYVQMVMSTFWPFHYQNLNPTFLFEEGVVFLVPTYMVILGWAFLARMDPVDLKDKFLPPTAVLMALVIVYQVVA
jgi:hypothetical protein